MDTRICRELYIFYVSMVILNVKLIINNQTTRFNIEKCDITNNKVQRCIKFYITRMRRNAALFEAC